MVKSPFIRTKRRYVPYKGQTITDPSMTVPDQTMSLRTILDRHARQLPLTLPGSIPVYNGEDDDGVDINHLDLVDREDYINARKQELADIKQRIVDTEKEWKKKKAENLHNALKLPLQQPPEDDKTAAQVQ